MRKNKSVKIISYDDDKKIIEWMKSEEGRDEDEEEEEKLKMPYYFA